MGKDEQIEYLQDALKQERRRAEQAERERDEALAYIDRAKEAFQEYIDTGFDELLDVLDETPTQSLDRLKAKHYQDANDDIRRVFPQLQGVSRVLRDRIDELRAQGGAE